MNRAGRVVLQLTKCHLVIIVIGRLKPLATSEFLSKVVHQDLRFLFAFGNDDHTY